MAIIINQMFPENMKVITAGDELDAVIEGMHTAWGFYLVDWSWRKQFRENGSLQLADDYGCCETLFFYQVADEVYALAEHKPNPIEYYHAVNRVNQFC